MSGDPILTPDPGDPIGPEGFRGATSNVASTQNEFFANPRKYRSVALEIQHVEAARLLALHSPRGDEIVLDVGSGDGDFSANQLLDAFPSGRVFGLDVGIANVRAASSDYKKPISAGKLRFFVGDIREPSEWYDALGTELGEPPKLDVVFTNSTLHHIYTWEGQNQALENITNLLESGGVFLNSMAGKGNFDHLVSIGMDLANAERWSKYFPGFEYPLLRPDVDTYASVLREHKLQPEHIELAPLIVQLQSQDTLVRFCRGCMRSFMSHLGERLSAAGVADVDANLDEFALSMAERFVADIGVQEGETIPFPEVNLEVFARKE